MTTFLQGRFDPTGLFSYEEWAVIARLAIAAVRLARRQYDDAGNKPAVMRGPDGKPKPV